MPALRIGHVEVFVRDPSVARRFYEDVLGFEVDDVQAGGRIVWLRLGDRLILLRPGEPRVAEAVAHPVAARFAGVLLPPRVELRGGRLRAGRLAATR